MPSDPPRAGLAPTGLAQTGVAPRGYNPLTAISFGALLSILISLPCLAQTTSTRVTSTPARYAALDSAENLQIFESCWENVQARFYDPSLLAGIWDAIGDRYRPAAARAHTPRALREVLRAMVGELKTSHLTVMHTDVHNHLSAELRNQPTLNHGVLLETMPDTGYTFVRCLYEGGAATDAGLRRGDRIVLVDGVAPERSENVQFAGYDPGIPGNRLSFLRAKEDANVSLVLQRTPSAASRQELSLQPTTMNAVDACRNSVFALPVEEYKIGTLHIWYCSEGVAGVVREALRTDLRECQALVIDLRGRGGRPSVLRELHRMFRDADLVGGKELVFLTDKRSRSAKDALAYLIRDDGIGELVGEPTAGAVLGGGYIPLSDDTVLEVPFMSFPVRGVNLEGNPVKPHVAVNDEIPFAAGKDAIFTAGIRRALEMLKNPRKTARL